MNHAHVSLILDNQINRIIREHGLGTIIISAKLAAYVKDFPGFRNISETQRMSYKDSTGCVNVGHLNQCFIIADSSISETDMSIYAYGDTEETCNDRFKVATVENVIVYNNTMLSELFDLLKPL